MGRYCTVNNILHSVTSFIKFFSQISQHSFDSFSHLISQLYRGRLENGTQVAIRCLPSSKKYSIRNLKLRLDLLAKLRHPHLVCLLGHCIDGGGQDHYTVNKVFLIYEFVPDGNFRTHLSGKILYHFSSGLL